MLHEIRSPSAEPGDTKFLAGIEVLGGLNADFVDFFRLCLEILLQHHILSDILKWKQNGK